ncbi:DUF6504 family protein [Angustibacter aerolatus]
MVRRYDEQVDVRCEGDPPGVDLDPDEPRQPVAFVWRGRFYDVRAVQARWYERRGWWRDPSGLALLGLGADPDAPSGGRLATVPAEREVWRVEAAAGRCSPVGVYELVHDPARVPAWQLTSVDD